MLDERKLTHILDEIVLFVAFILDLDSSGRDYCCKQVNSQWHDVQLHCVTCHYLIWFVNSKWQDAEDLKLRYCTTRHPSCPLHLNKHASNNNFNCFQVLRIMYFASSQLSSEIYNLLASSTRSNQSSNHYTQTCSMFIQSAMSRWHRALTSTSN